MHKHIATWNPKRQLGEEDQTDLYSGAVCGDLADAGYDCIWDTKAASSVGAPHRRERVFMVAVRRGMTCNPLPHWSYGEEASDDQQVELLPTPTLSDTKTPQDSDFRKSGGHTINLADAAITQRLWHKYADSIARWETVTRPAPPPTELNRNGRPRLNAAFSEWMMGWPNGWVTDRQIGLPRVQQLKAIGNGVVPQQASAAIRDLLTVFSQVNRAATF